MLSHHRDRLDRVELSSWTDATGERQDIYVRYGYTPQQAIRLPGRHPDAPHPYRGIASPGHHQRGRWLAGQRSGRLIRAMVSRTEPWPILRHVTGGLGRDCPGAWRDERRPPRCPRPADPRNQVQDLQRPACSLA